MQLPKRHPNHIMETESWKLLHAVIPSHWILREITERDYGIDAYLELVTTDGFVTGDLVSLQLKGQSAVEWKEEVFSFKGTRKETIAYWMKLPVPVFLCIADISQGSVYFVPVKDSVRKHFAAYSQQQTLTFHVSRRQTLNDETGLKQFLAEYTRERRHQRCAFDLTTLLANCTRYAEFCQDRHHRDCHLPLEPHNLLEFVHLHGIAHSVAVHLGVDWGLDDISRLLVEDRRVWKDDYCELHEGTALEFVQKFAPKLATIIESARHHVAVEYSDFWRKTDSLLWQSCQEFSEYSYVITHAQETLNNPH